MSISSAGISESDKIYKKSSHNHRRKDSGELDVFEATRYFSDYNETPCYNHHATYTSKINESWRAGRKSIDIPLRDLLLQQSHKMENPKKEKKHKQPSSPGVRLASFLYSFFNQAALSKKKKSKSMKDEDESPGGRRWRRSNISHIRSSSTADSRSTIYPSSSSGFKTPPPYTSNKVYRNLASYLADKQEVSDSKNITNGHVKSTIYSKDVLDKKMSKDFAWLDEKLRLNNGLIEKCKISGSSNKLENDRKNYPSEEREIREFDELHDDGDSDSSSDLFELQNYDLGYYPSGLPVYETTHLNNIKRGASTSNGPL